MCVYMCTKHEVKVLVYICIHIDRVCIHVQRSMLQLQPTLCKLHVGYLKARF